MIGITLSGIDERTDLIALEEKIIDADLYGEVEVGILYTHSPAGRHRYPRKEWILENTPNFGWISIHICGSRARKELLNGELDSMLISADRIQINGVVDETTLRQVCKKYKRHGIITQHNNANELLVNVNVYENHCILIDSSGGKGIIPFAWPEVITGKPLGFAGGLDAESIKTQLPLIKAVIGNDPWVDAENKLRDENDWFSIEKAVDFAISVKNQYNKV